MKHGVEGVQVTLSQNGLLGNVAEVEKCAECFGNINRYIAFQSHDVNLSYVNIVPI